MNSQTTREKGMQSEDRAAKYLESLGFQIIEKNWTSGKLEVDLIATTSSMIVFVEVKSRYSDKFGAPWEAVNSAKRRSIIRAADIYIQRHNVTLEPRFDIISIITNSQKETIDHYEGAFFPYA
jgi:putative endonuclease